MTLPEITIFVDCADFSSIRKALELQMSGVGFTMVEILSPCPTGWTMLPTEAVDWLEKNMIPVFPLGEIKKPEAQAKKTR